MFTEAEFKEFKTESLNRLKPVPIERETLYTILNGRI